MGLEGSQDERTLKVVDVMVGMLHEAMEKFNADGHFPPQAYIVRLDGTAHQYEPETENFDAEAFADYIEQQISKERGVAVLSIAEMWFVDNWDGVGRVSERPDRYEALVATAEMVNNPTLLYTWPIRRHADGTARVAQMRPPVRCESGLFRLGSLWTWAP